MYLICKTLQLARTTIIKHHAVTMVHIFSTHSIQRIANRTCRYFRTFNANNYGQFPLLFLNKTGFKRDFYRLSTPCNCSEPGLRQNFSYLFSVKYNNLVVACGKRSFCAGNETKHSDININQNNWTSSFSKKIQPYMILARVDRPIGNWLLFLPCTWSISLASDVGSLQNFYLLTLFGIGSILMRGSGCVINDLWDADLDRKVSRTASRPLASGEISLFQGLLFLGAQLSCALAVLLSLNNYSIVLGASSVVLAVIYPLMKRITFWPQIFLGATLNWGCLLGWSAVHGSLDLSVCLPLYVAAINWTVIYDTIYSFQDIKDDEIIGVKSTALLFGDEAKLYLSGFAAIMMTNLLLVGVNSAQTWPYYAGLGAVASHLTWQLSQVNLSQPKDCLEKFKSNKWLGILLTISIVASMLLKQQRTKEETSDRE